jgi:hypothetical protein
MMMLVVGGMFVFILSIVAIFVISYWTANNYGAKTEAQLKSMRDDNQNILAQYQQKIMEATQVPDMYRDDYKKILEAEMSGRYGADGSKANFQWIQEHALNFDSKLYTNLQEMIAAGRKDFEQGQRRMLDARGKYEGELNTTWRGTFLGMAGYPKIDLKEYQPVITDSVESAFKAGKESAPLKLR